MDCIKTKTIAMRSAKIDRLIISFIFFTNNPTTSKVTADKKIKNSGMIGIKILTNILPSQWLMA